MEDFPKDKWFEQNFILSEMYSLLSSLLGQNSCQIKFVKSSVQLTVVGEGDDIMAAWVREAPIDSCIWMFGSLLVGLFQERLGGVAFLEEVCH